MRCLDAATRLYTGNGSERDMDALHANVLATARLFLAFVDPPHRVEAGAREVADAIERTLRDHPDDWSDPIEVDPTELREWLADLRGPARPIG